MSLISLSSIPLIFYVYLINPFPASVPIRYCLAKISILIQEGITKKNSYERRNYESVDEKKEPILFYVPKNEKKKKNRSKRV